MRYLKIIFGILWKTLFLLNFAISLILLYPLFYILLSRKNLYPHVFFLKKLWARWLFTFPGIITKIKYESAPNNFPQPAVYCANHASYLDVAAGYIVIPNYFVSMGKKELYNIPLFRRFFKDMNILVDRKSITASHKAFLRAGKELEQGNSLFLFPEGGILSNDGKLHRFKSGAFKLAIDHQVPVVPITFLNNWKLFQNGVMTRTHGRPGIARVVVHQPISTVGMTSNDLVSLQTQVHDIIQNELDNYNRKHESR